MDKLRARYHFQPEKNWMNDPNGPVVIDGKLHLFYQYNPYGAAWGNMTWGHAVAQDLTVWKHLPCALHPDMPYDKDGVFSGCCVMKDGLPHILYTGVQPEVQCLAIGDKNAEHFEKYEHNPIIVRQEGEQLNGFRDPFAWQEDGMTYIAIGSGEKGKRGFAFVYRSEDLKHWERVGELCSGNDPEEDMWECPNFIRFPDGSATLLVSLMKAMRVYAMDGKYHDHKLDAGALRPFDLGDSFYAPNTVTLPDGRIVNIGWMKETIPGREAAGWQGMMTLPREVVQYGDGAVGVRPVSEVARLRGERLASKKEFTLRSGENALKGVHSRNCEIFLEFEAGSQGELVLELCKSERGEEKCVVTYDGVSDAIWADCSRCGGAKQRVGGYVAGRGVTKLRVFLDGSALEVYVNDRETLTTRVYPAREDSDGMRLYAEGGVRVRRMQVYEMKSGYEEE